MNLKLKSYFLFSLLTISLSVLLCNCSTITKSSQSNWRIIPKNRLQKINKFELSGRIGVISHGHSDSGDFTWQQNDKNNYQLIIYGPLHQGNITLTVTPEHAILIDQNKQKIIANTPEELIQDYTSWYIPTHSMQKWILGISDNSAPIKTEYYETQGILIYLEQNNWKINYLEYSNFNGFLMPKKLQLNNGVAKIKILVKRWLF